MLSFFLIIFGIPLGVGVGRIRSRPGRYMALAVASIVPLLLLTALGLLWSQGHMKLFANFDSAFVVNLLRLMLPWAIGLLSGYLLFGRPPRKRWEDEQDRYIP